MLDIAYVNAIPVIAQNPKMTAINSAIEVDLTGQVCSDSIGTRMYSGFGGQVDFIRGAAEGFDGKGKPIIALPAVTKRNESKIVPTIKLGMLFQLKYSFHKSNQILLLLLILCLFSRWRCCNVSCPRSLCSHWIWYCISVWKIIETASTCIDQYFSSRSSGKPGKVRIRTS